MKGVFLMEKKYHLYEEKIVRDKLKKEKKVGEYVYKRKDEDGNIFKKRLVYYKPKYISKLEKELEQENKKIIILGTVMVKELPKKETEKDRQGKEKSENNFLALNDDTPIFLIQNTKTKGRTLGYVNVGENTFVRIAKKTMIFPLVLLLILGCIILFWLKSGSPGVKPVDKVGSVQSTVTPSGNSKAGVGEIEFPGDLYFVDTVTTKNNIVPLGNPKTNDVYFKYIIKEKGSKKVLFTSKLVKPGTAFRWDAYKTLGKGTHHLDVSIQTFDVKKYFSCVGATQDDITIVVK